MRVSCAEISSGFDVFSRAEKKMPKNIQYLAGTAIVKKLSGPSKSLEVLFFAGRNRSANPGNQRFVFVTGIFTNPISILIMEKRFAHGRADLRFLPGHGADLWGGFGNI